MTQGKKKKRAANRSIMLAKKIIIKDGGTVSAGSAPQGGPGAGPARSSPRFRLRWAGSALPSRAAGAAAGTAAVSACGLRGLAPLKAAGTSGPPLCLRSLRPRPTCARPASGRRRRTLRSLARPSAARGEAGQPCAPYAVAGGRRRGPLGQGTCVVRSRSPAARAAALSCSATLSGSELVPCPGVGSLTLPGAFIISSREIITLCLKITVFRIGHGVRIGDRFWPAD